VVKHRPRRFPQFEEGPTATHTTIRSIDVWLLIRNVYVMGVPNGSERNQAIKVRFRSATLKKWSKFTWKDQPIWIYGERFWIVVIRHIVGCIAITNYSVAAFRWLTKQRCAIALELGAEKAPISRIYWYLYPSW
jgi:hypothetical protein